MLTRVKPAERIGQKFGRLTVQSVHYADGAYGRYSVAVCRCSCGSEHTARLQNVVRGAIESCGCIRREFLSPEAMEARSSARAAANLVRARKRGERREERAKSAGVRASRLAKWVPGEKTQKQAVLDVLLNGRASSCDIEAELGLATKTVSAVLSALAAEGVVRKAGTDSGPTGRTVFIYEAV